jgi:two-component system, cell cycle sensor histidine kinase and response regulator CckA
MSNAQILVVDDEPIVAKNIQMELSSMGYTVPAIAASGEEALEKAGEMHPDLVLMDISLKGSMDGVETSKRMQERFDIPVVYLTAYADERTLQRAKKTGAFGYLLKPYEEKELQTTIEIALHKHKQEVARRQMQQWLASTLRSIGEAVIVADARGCISMLNRTAEKLTGWSQEEALGRELQDVFVLVDPQTRTPGANPATRALREGKACNLEEDALLLGKHGKETPVEGSIAPTYDEQGSFTGFVVVFRDITARKEAEEALGQSAEQVRQGQEMEMIGRLAGGMAHDFNQLLTAILGNLSLVLAQLPPTDPNRELVANAEKAALQAAEVVKQLLGFARQARIHLQPVNLNPLVQEMVDTLCCLVDPRIAIEFTPAPDLWTVRATSAQLKEVLLNLCLNARDAMPQGGQLLVQTENVLVEEVPAGAPGHVRRGEFVCLRFADTGQGIPSEILSRIFEPFFSTKGSGKGTGLGLALVLAIIEQHDGWITCHSEIGQGTRFDIYLPRHK